MANNLADQRNINGISDVDIIGAAPSFPSRLKGHYRWQIILRGSRPELLLSKVVVPRGWTIEVDPVTVM